MSDFVLFANKNQLSVRKREPITSGSVNVYEALFEFSYDWDGLKRLVTFRAGDIYRSIVLDANNACLIPWETMVIPNVILYVGVCGTKDEDIILPTIWAKLGTILQGSETGIEILPPTPDVWQQILDKIPEPMSAEELRTILVGGE